MLRWMLGNLLVWAVLFFGVPYAGVRFVPPEAGMMFTMALWLAVYPLYIALASHSAAQRKWNTLWLPLVHPALYALGVWLVSTLCWSLHIARVIWPWGTASGERAGA